MKTKQDDLVKAIVKGILADVTDRRGWRQEWDGFDDDIQAEIKATWKKIVKAAIAKH